MNIIDQKQRELALNPQYSFLIKAPAGSGKTSLLIARIEQLIKIAHPSQITALTFTKNSAREIINRLQEKEIDTAGIQIATYDAWIARLLKKLSPTPALPISQNQNLLYDIAWQRAFADMKNDPAHPITHILQHHWQLFPLLKKTCINLLSRRDLWLPLIFKQHSSWVTSQWQMMLEHCAHDLIQQMGSYWHGLRQFYIEFEGSPDINPPQPIDELANMARWLLTKSGTPRKPTQKMGFEPISCAKSPKQATFKKADFLTIIEHIQQRPSLLRLWQIFQKIDQEPRPEFITHIAEFLPKLLAHLKVVFQEHHEVDYCENALNLLEILTDQSAFNHPELRHTQHLLLDEFQDTSPLQFAILGAFIREWSDDQQSSVFLVGDPMQSIYGFRDADVRLILDIEKQSRFHHLPIQTLQLITNFRSQQSLINFQNQIFTNLMSPHQDINWCDIIYQPSIGIYQDLPSTVHYHTYEIDEKNAGILHILKSIPKNQTIGILTPTRKSGLEVLRYIQQHFNQPVHAANLTKPANNPLIHDTLILFHAICHPECRLSWIALSQTPWFKIEHQHLQTLFINQKPSFLQQLLDANNLMPANLICQQIQDRLSTETPFQILIHTLKYINPSILHHPILQNTFSALENLSIPFDHLSDLIDWANQIEAPDDEEHHRIQITTIHQAKGLEYDHVILPFLNHISPPSKPDIISVDSWITNQRPIPAALIASPIDQTHHQAILSFLQKHKMLQEKKRLLYVALTRAKQGLHFFFEPKTHENSLQFWLTPNP